MMSESVENEREGEKGDKRPKYEVDKKERMERGIKMNNQASKA